MAITKMNFVSVNTDSKHLDEMLKACVKSQLLHPEPAINVVNDENQGRLISDENVYAEYSQNLKTLAYNIGIDLVAGEVSKKTYSKKEIENFIEYFGEQVNLATIKEANYLTEDDKKALEKVNAYDFEKIHKCVYLSFGFGRMPIDSYKKLTLYTNQPFIINRLHENNQYYWVLYVTSHTFARKIDNIFDSLYLERISIPNIDVKKVVAKFKDALQDIYTYCVLNDELHQLYKYVLIMHKKHVICGFVPTEKLETFKSFFEGIPVDFRIKSVREVPQLKSPTLLKNNWFFKPFEIFVDMYSIPNYFEIDPTIFVGITYSILFGVMFGDLGQGLVLFLIGAYFEIKKKNVMMAIIARVGIFSIIFGFLFGSVFGNEHILNGVHEHLFNVRGKLFEVMSVSNTMALLISAIMIGAILILVSIILNIYIKMRQKDFEEALFSQNGLAGLVFYGYVLFAIYMTAVQQTSVFTPVYITLCVVIPILCFFFKELLGKLLKGQKPRPHDKWSDYILEMFFEVAEILLSFLTNSLSYLRVGGFVLSHAGMMLVVMTLVEMTGTSGIVVLILGNIFVIGLEGLIVGIQTLRLEYYEMFSRYYEGGGIKYEVLACKK